MRFVFPPPAFQSCLIRCLVSSPSLCPSSFFCQSCAVAFPQKNEAYVVLFRDQQMRSANGTIMYVYVLLYIIFMPCSSSLCTLLIISDPTAAAIKPCPKRMQVRQRVIQKCQIISIPTNFC